MSGGNTKVKDIRYIYLLVYACVRACVRARWLALSTKTGYGGGGYMLMVRTAAPVVV